MLHIHVMPEWSNWLQWQPLSRAYTQWIENYKDWNTWFWELSNVARNNNWEKLNNHIFNQSAGLAKPNHQIWEEDIYTKFCQCRSSFPGSAVCDVQLRRENKLIFMRKVNSTDNFISSVLKTLQKHQKHELLWCFIPLASLAPCSWVVLLN